MEQSREDAEKKLRAHLGYSKESAPSLPELDYSQELIHSNRPVDISSASVPSSDEMMLAV